jgi:hypothetical protein
VDTVVDSSPSTTVRRPCVGVIPGGGEEKRAQLEEGHPASIMNAGEY